MGGIPSRRGSRICGKGGGARLIRGEKGGAPRAPQARSLAISGGPVSLIRGKGGGGRPLDPRLPAVDVNCCCVLSIYW